MGGILMESRKLILRNARPGSLEATPADILIADGVVRHIGEVEDAADAVVVDAAGAVAIPGLVDVHVHFREPGFGYKERILTGSRAAAAGGFTSVCTMPNLNPVPDSIPNLRQQLDIIDRDALIEVIPYGAITMTRMGTEFVDYPALAPYVCAFSDDGTGIDDEKVMAEAMSRIARTGKVLAEHCEVRALVHGGCIHDGKFANANNIPGISSESEWKEVERDIRLAADTGCRLHICHVSTAESVDLIRRGKRNGVKVTAETAAHYLAFCDDDLKNEGRFKMNPPIRSAVDRKALITGIQDGTIDCIASDHAPHAENEKNLGLTRSAMGVTGLETALPAVYTTLVKTGIISFGRMIELMALNPRRIFGIKGGIDIGQRADLAIVDLDAENIVDSSRFFSMGKATPFDGCALSGKVTATVAAGKLVFHNGTVL